MSASVPSPVAAAPHGYRPEGKNVLVTGAAGDIGAEIARAFLARGARVHATDIDARMLAARVSAAGHPGAITSSVCDLAEDSPASRRWPTRRRERLGGIDILVNNAAFQPQGDLEACSPEVFDRAYAINVRAPYLLARALVPAMRAAGGGAIVNIASVHATAPGPKRLAYATAETSAARHDPCARRRSRAIQHPGQRRLAGGHADRAVAVGMVAQQGPGGVDVMTHAIAQHPLGRIAEVSDIAEAVVYLAEARFVSGIDLRVDGGFLASLRLLPAPGSAPEPTISTQP